MAAVLRDGRARTARCACAATTRRGPGRGPRPRARLWSRLLPDTLDVGVTGPTGRRRSERERRHQRMGPAGPEHPSRGRRPGGRVLLPTLVTLARCCCWLHLHRGLDRPAVVPARSTTSTVFSTVLSPGAAVHRVRAVLLAGRRRPTSSSPTGSARSSVPLRARNEALDRYRASSTRSAAGADRAGPCSVCSPAAWPPAVADVHAVAQRRRLGHRRLGVPPRHRLLRLRLPVAAVPDVVRVRDARRRDDRGRDHPLPVRRHLPAGGGAARSPAPRRCTCRCCSGCSCC